MYCSCSSLHYIGPVYKWFNLSSIIRIAWTGQPGVFMTHTLDKSRLEEYVNRHTPWPGTGSLSISALVLFVLLIEPNPFCLCFAITFYNIVYIARIFMNCVLVSLNFLFKMCWPYTKESLVLSRRVLYITAYYYIWLYS